MPNNLKYNNIIKLPNKIYFVECYCHHEAHELLWMGMYIFYQTIYIQRCCYWQEFLGLESKHNYSYSYSFTPTLLAIFPKDFQNLPPLSILEENKDNMYVIIRI